MTGSVNQSAGLFICDTEALSTLFNESFGLFFIPDFYYFRYSLQKDQQKDCLRQ